MSSNFLTVTLVGVVVLIAFIGWVFLSRRDGQKAAFLIKEARDLDITDTKLRGFSGGVVNAGKVRDVRTKNLEANASAMREAPSWWTHPITLICVAVVAGLLLFYAFGVN